MIHRRLSATHGESTKDESGWAIAHAAKGANATNAAAGHRPTLPAWCAQTLLKGTRSEPGSCLSVNAHASPPQASMAAVAANEM